MKIAYLVGAFPTVRETFVLHEVLDLVRRGVDVRIFSWNVPAEQAEHREISESGILDRVHYFRYRQLPAVATSIVFRRAALATVKGRHRDVWRTRRDRLTAACFAAQISALQPDLLHSHLCTPIVRPIAEMAGVPYGFTAHCFEDELMDSDERESLSDTIAGARLVVAASDFVRRGLQGMVQPSHAEKIRTVRCGIEAGPTPDWGTADRDIDVLCVAGLGPSKGIEYLIQAAGALRPSRPGLRIVSVGGRSSYHAAYADGLHEQWERCGAEGVFEFAGAKRADEVQALLRRSRVFALPCITADDGHMDGLPVALMEAAAAGLPLISTDVAGIPELVQDGVTGIVVPQRDPDALGDAIARLLDDEELRNRLGRGARARVEDEFGRGLNGDRLMAALEWARAETSDLVTS